MGKQTSYSQFSSASASLGRASSGFTILEVIITLVVAAVLVVGVVPNLADFVTRNRAVSTTNDFLATIQYARSEALIRGTWVLVCRRPQVTDSDAACTDANLTVASHCSCVTTSSSNTADGWEDGWLVVADADRSLGVSAGDNLLRVAGPVGGGFTVRGNTGVVNQFEFEPDATVNASFGSFFVCGPGSDTDPNSQRMLTARKVVLNQVGRAIAANADSCS